MLVWPVREEEIDLLRLFPKGASLEDTSLEDTSFEDTSFEDTSLGSTATESAQKPEPEPTSDRTNR